MNNKPTPPSTSSGVFVSTVTVLENGDFVQKLDDALRSLTTAISDTGKKGNITLNLTIKPNGVGLGGFPLFQVLGEIKVKTPTKAPEGQSFFADEEHNLTRRNPKQDETMFREVTHEEPVSPAQKAQ